MCVLQNVGKTQHERISGNCNGSVLLQTGLAIIITDIYNIEMQMEA